MSEMDVSLSIGLFESNWQRSRSLFNLSKTMLITALERHEQEPSAPVDVKVNVLGLSFYPPSIFLALDWFFSDLELSLRCFGVDGPEGLTGPSSTQNAEASSWSTTQEVSASATLLCLCDYCQASATLYCHQKARYFAIICCPDASRRRCATVLFEKWINELNTRYQHHCH